MIAVREVARIINWCLTAYLFYDGINRLDNFTFDMLGDKLRVSYYDKILNTTISEETINIHINELDIIVDTLNKLKINTQVHRK